MSRKPILNALAATGYIVLVAMFFFYGKQFIAGPDTILMPISALSLLVLSAVTMSYLFFYQPLQLYLDGEKKQALALFTQTLAAFAAITLVILVGMVVASA